MSRGDLSRNLTLLGGALGFAAMLIGFGYALGTYRSTAGFERILDAAESVDTLGKLVPLEQRRGVAEVFLDPDEALEIFDTIAWTVPSAPTPFVGYAPAPGQHHNAHVNAWQMRGTALPRLPKAADAYRVFITGASVAFGIGAPSDDRTIGGYLQTELDAKHAAGARRFEVFTFASTGWTTTHERIAIENRLSELDPDLVIAYSGVNDMYLNATGRDTRWSRSWGDQHFFDLLAEATRLAGRPFVDVAPPNSPPRTPVEVARRIAENARLAATALDAVGARYLYALQPNIAYATKQLTPREAQLLAAYRFRDYNRRCQAAIRAQLAAPAFDFVDLSDVFSAVPANEGIFIDTGHLGDRGNRIVAIRLAAEVERIADAAP